MKNRWELNFFILFHILSCVHSARPRIAFHVFEWWINWLIFVTNSKCWLPNYIFQQFLSFKIQLNNSRRVISTWRNIRTKLPEVPWYSGQQHFYLGVINKNRCLVKEDQTPTTSSFYYHWASYNICKALGCEYSSPSVHSKEQMNERHFAITALSRCGFLEIRVHM